MFFVQLNDQIDMDEETHDEQLTNDIDDFEVAFPFLLFSFLTLVFLSLRYPLGFSFNKFLNLSQVSESSRIDDESQYSAVAHFNPNKVCPLS